MFFFCPGKTSFQSLKLYGSEQHETFQDVCAALGLLESDREWESLLCDASNTLSSRSIRKLFGVLLVFCEISNPKELFEKHIASWYDDYRRDYPDFSDVSFSHYEIFCSARSNERGQNPY